MTIAHWWRKLGPGLVTGAADDDPSGIATYAQVGAQFGFGLLWVISAQLVSARLGRVTGHGVAYNMRRYYSYWMLYGAVWLVFVTWVTTAIMSLAAIGFLSSLAG